MIKVILIEDELQARNGLKKILNLIEPNLSIIGETGLVKEAIRLIDTQKPDLVFMDIELEDGSSFDVLEQFNTIKFKIIFITAYNQYAINAFKFSATDYLLKPIDPVELKSAISRAKDVINNEKEHYKLLEVLKNNIKYEEKKIVLKTSENRFIIKVSDIIRLEADSAYTIFITQTKRILVSKNLKYYEDLLGNDFVRCHQSHLINKNHIVSTYKNEYFMMINNDKVNISSRKRQVVFQYLNL